MNGIIREYDPGDIPELKEIWLEAFGDTEALIDGFFELLPNAGTGFVCISNGHPASMAYVLDGLSVNGKSCGYIYAVATKKQARSAGYGAAVVKACAEHAKKSGCEIISTAPAERELFDWYGRLLGTECAVCSGNFSVELENINAPMLEMERISAGDYNNEREKMLAHRPHVCFPDGYMAIEEMICRVCGGGLYRLGGGVAACYAENGVLKIKELLCPHTTSRSSIASLMKKHGVSRAVVHESGSNTPYIAAAPAEAAENLWWGPVLD